MACGCGKARMARPLGAATTVQASQQRQSSPSAKVVSVSSPYMKQKNVAPAHLQGSLTRKTV